MCRAKVRSSSVVDETRHAAVTADNAPPRRRSKWRRLLWRYCGGGPGEPMFPVNRERWRRFKAWSKRKMLHVEEKIDLITLWVFNFNFNFAFFALPVLFAIFLAILSPYHDIQACVCGGLLVVLFSCLALNNQGFLDIPGGSNFRFKVHRFFEKREVVEFGSDFSGVSLSVEMKTYKMLPLNEFSRLWGSLADTELPGPLKYLSIWLFSKLMKCNREEAEFDCLTEYKTISQFFRRRLKPGLRPVCNKNDIVSPADGRLTHVGPVEGLLLEQVKGIRYSFESFLGPVQFESNHLKQVMSKEEEEVNLSVTDSTHSSETWHYSSCQTKCADDTQSQIDRQCLTTHSYDEREEAMYEKELVNQLAAYDRDADAYDQADTCLIQRRIEKTVCCQKLSGDESRELSQDQRMELSQDVGMELSQLVDIAESCDIIQTFGETALYQAVVYLSPSDYHRFHSPADWVVMQRRHFPGKLYSVSPAIVRQMPGLFHTNERVVLLGKWRHGFFSMSAVGATNVGSIRINFDEDLETNSRAPSGRRTYTERVFPGGVRLSKGEEVGYFNFGSTIVLVFEAPASYTFNKTANDRIKVGEGV